MVDVKGVLKALEKIKKTEDKLSYINEFLKLKSLEDRLEILKAISDEIKDDDFRKEIEIIIEEIDLPENTSKPEITRAELEPEQEIVEAKKPERLEDAVEREKVREEGRSLDYFTPANVFYQSTSIGDTPLLANIKRDLEREGLFKEGRFVSDEQRTMIRDRIEKYMPTISQERITDYVNLIAEPRSTRYETKFSSLNVREILKEKKPNFIKYEPEDTVN